MDMRPDIAMDVQACIRKTELWRCLHHVRHGKRSFRGRRHLKTKKKGCRNLIPLSWPLSVKSYNPLEEIIGNKVPEVLLEGRDTRCAYPAFQRLFHCLQANGRCRGPNIVPERTICTIRFFLQCFFACFKTSA